MCLLVGQPTSPIGFLLLLRGSNDTQTGDLGRGLRGKGMGEVGKRMAGERHWIQGDRKQRYRHGRVAMSAKTAKTLKSALGE